jgi:hypothetical protein
MAFLDVDVVRVFLVLHESLGIMLVGLRTDFLTFQNQSLHTCKLMNSVVRYIVCVDSRKIIV